MIDFEYLVSKTKRQPPEDIVEEFGERVSILMFDANINESEAQDKAFEMMKDKIYNCEWR